jgi:thiamine pyrophosphate-dependent acetolactate synthase large subunit-like protein
MRKPSRHVLLEMLVNHGVGYAFGNPGMEFFQPPLDCASVAEAFGVQGFKVDDPADLNQPLKKSSAWESLPW